MELDKQLELFERLTRIETKIDIANESFNTHTENDTASFNKISDELQTLFISKAKAEGMQEASERGAKIQGAITGGTVSAVIAAISAYFSK